MNEVEGILKTRRDFYAFLCRMFLEEPARELAADLVNGRFFSPEPKALEASDELSKGFQEFKDFMERNKGKTVDELQGALRDEYTRLFILPHGHPVQPYESWWIDKKLMGDSLITVKREYRRAGIAKSPDYPELDDHIAFELTFMRYLCDEELAAESDERLQECLHLQREFLQDHLLKWIPAFCDGLYEWDVTDFFKGIAKITKGFILLDARVVRELLEDMQ